MTICQALLDLPPLLVADRLHVIEMPEWRTRDRTAKGQTFHPIAIILHHDGMGLDNTNVAINMIKPQSNGAQIWIRRNGDVHMLAAGRMNHAGLGAGYHAIPTNCGNEYSIGIETDYAGSGIWPIDLLNSLRVVNHRLAQLLHLTDVYTHYCGHREYAPGRKFDPGNLDISAIRGQLALDLSGLQGSIAPVIPPVTQTVKDDDVANVVMMKLGGSDTIYMVDFGTHKKWAIANLDDLHFYQNVGIPLLTGDQAPQSIDDFELVP